MNHSIKVDYIYIERERERENDQKTQLLHTCTFGCTCTYKNEEKLLNLKDSPTKYIRENALVMMQINKHWSPLKRLIIIINNNKAMPMTHLRDGRPASFLDCIRERTDKE